MQPPVGVVGGNTQQPKRLRVIGTDIAPVVAAWARVQGYEVTSTKDDAYACDLVIVEGCGPHDLPAEPQHAPLVVVANRRLQPTKVRALLSAGATRVLDAEASVLDVAFVLSDLMFGSLGELRRYAEQLGAARVTFRPRDDSGDEARGRLVGMARAGAYLRTAAAYPAGTPLTLELDLEGTPIQILCRVACRPAGCDGQRGFGVEFALDAHDVAPRLAAFRNGRPPPRPSSDSELLHA